MLNALEKKLFLATKDQIYQLLLCAWCYKEKFYAFGSRLQNQPMKFMVEELTSLRLIANGVILHLCNLDDERSNFSLHAMKKTINRSGPVPQREKIKFNTHLSEYRSSINHLKNEHRISYIAHRSNIDYPAPLALPDLYRDLLPCIKKALITFELAWGSEVHFGVDPGGESRLVHFCAELGIERVSARPEHLSSRL